eukprot:TRINITY_DN16313_c0_g1_i1.p1 TRINITY_DN16313_c0_g1~~TRINITY_DN16313_c0_g1_i1.p1  ORF type:complete len:330 (+),score=62.92 TRINITY_DN16313_c0_g1_i1:145-1134(+)
MLSRLALQGSRRWFACSSKSAAADIVVVGANVIDMIAYVPRFPAAGETLHGQDFQTGFGGKGANQGVAAAKLGSRVSMVSRVGSDTNGEETMKNFSKHNVDASAVSVSAERPTGVAPIAVDQNGSNTVIVVMGANDELSPKHVEEQRRLISASKLVMCQLEVPAEVSLAALRIAKEEGVHSILNTAPAQQTLPDEFFQVADIVCPNQPELELLTGMPTSTIQEAAAAASKLLERGAAQVICTLGKDGCMLVNEHEQYHVPATDDVAIDTVGAGDAFLGAFAHFFVQSGGDVKSSMRHANVVSGISVTRRGTQTSFPAAEEVVNLDGLLG